MTSMKSHGVSLAFTPPEAAKMSPVPAGALKGRSHSSSGLPKSMPQICIIRLSCRVVITVSASATPKIFEESSPR